MAKNYGSPGDRILSPDCTTSEKLAACDIGAQLLYDRLQVKSDDQGRRKARVSGVFEDCFPRMEGKLTERKVGEWLDQLAGVGLIVLYDVSGIRLLQIATWWRYQHTQRRAYPSPWPGPTGWTDLVYGRRGDEHPNFEAAAIAAGLVTEAAADEDDSAEDVPRRSGASAAHAQHARRTKSAPSESAPAVAFASANAGASAERMSAAGAAPAPDGSPTRGSTRSPRKPSGPVQETLTWFAARYAELRGSAYPIRAKDAVTITRLLKSFSVEEVRARFERGLTADDAFLDRTDRGIPVLSTQINSPALRGLESAQAAGGARSNTTASLAAVARVAAKLHVKASGDAG